MCSRILLIVICRGSDPKVFAVAQLFMKLVGITDIASNAHTMSNLFIVSSVA